MMTFTLDFFIRSMANTIVAHIDPVLDDDGGGAAKLDNGWQWQQRYRPIWQ
ncbi:MAG: hypothetical protein GY869_20005 [Planctomycetes bacterium]|nr:hypothetical protein [Planctomycetota bacterium]